MEALTSMWVDVGRRGEEHGPSRGAAHLSQQQHIGRALAGWRAVLQ